MILGKDGDGNKLATKDLKELLIQKIESVEKLNDERFVNQEKALTLQTAELARRLDFLNGEAERLRIMQMTYLPRETYDINHSDLNKRTTELEAYRERSIGQQAVIASVISVAIGVLMLLLSEYFNRGKI